MPFNFNNCGRYSSDHGIPDMTALSKIDIQDINQNLKTRYNKDLIYTYTGSILIAVNPYKTIDIYSQDYIKKYNKRKLGELEPHIYAIAEAAYSLIQTNLCSLPISQFVEQSLVNQSIVISGESGAGKTENTKFILQYLCSVTSNVSSWVEHQILEANTILESFGNAKTIKNDNSSRFGKFIQVCFDKNWKIAGCFVQDYLLEQSRITFQSCGERNYHIFYQLIDAAKVNEELKDLLNLKEATFYNYLNQSGCTQIDGVSDSKKFESLILAFNILQISSDMSDGIFKVLSAILWLGNLSFEDIDGEKCRLAQSDTEILEAVAKLLGLQISSLLQVVLLRQINVRGNITEIPLKLSEARENRHAMAKALYSRTFAWLINHINNCINPGQESSRFLGVLDIFGFENFKVNSFEQLCINYTNEKLHKFFNHYVFALEQEIYKNEGVVFSEVKYTDNTMCLELIEKPPRCLLKLLTEQCHMPKGSDTAYLLNLHGDFENHPYYAKGDDRRKWETQFGVKHYAGSVTYTVKGFVDKNRDVQQDVFFDFMSRSTNVFVREITQFQDLLNGNCSMKIGLNGAGTVLRGTNKGKPTVGDTFRYQLQCLVDVLQSTNPWYVRCIKPNLEKKPNVYDNSLVLDQLKYLGMLDIIRIRKEGYPVHMVFEDFVNRYYFLQKTRKFPKNDLKIACQMIMEHEQLPKSQWQIGLTKIFLRTEMHKHLEQKHQWILSTSIILIQKVYRGYRAHRDYQRCRGAILVIQHAYRGWKTRIRFLRMKRSAVIIQSHLRGFFAREVANALREMRKVEEEMSQFEQEQLHENDDDSSEQNNNNNNEFETVQENERIVEDEIKTLSQISENLTAHATTTTIAQSVDLDNLFEFLTDLQNNNKTNKEADDKLIDQIDAEMDELVEDLDLELKNAIEEELNYSNRNSSNSNSNNSNNNIDSKPLIPSLPEPTEPPPPPPLIMATVQKEPIYESVIPRTLKNISNNVQITPKISNVENEAVRNHNQTVSMNEVVYRKSYSDNNSDKENRKSRIDKRLREFHHKDSHQVVEEKYHDIVEFAEKSFNNHERSPEGTIIQTLTRKSSKCIEIVPKYEMVTFHKGYTIPNSHINLHDPDNVTAACSIFRDLSKYFRGELNIDREILVIQSIIGYGIEREELRDEIYVQCIRQITNNPHFDWTEKIWLLLCLCIVSFQPSKQLHKYFVCFLKKNLQIDKKLKQYAQWCLDNCNCMKVSCREYPPSSDEIAAIRRLGTIVCRFFFLDGRTKAIDIHPTDTAEQAVKKLCDRLGLKVKDGWAVYQGTADGQEHVRAHYYLYDVIASWELRQNKFGSNSAFGTINRRNVNSFGAEDNKFIFKKRLFKDKILSQDPIEIGLLYAQAVYSVVKCDEFPVTERVALQLAGLQAQVALGNPKTNNKYDYYSDVEKYLPYRISRVRGENVWAPILAQAHVQYGAGRSELTAKALYLSCVMQYPLYGTTMFPVVFRGFWNYDNTLLLGVNYEKIQFIKLNEKIVLFECNYSNIESILLDPSDSFITITLTDNVSVNNKKCYVFETKQKNEIGSLIGSYCPDLSNWIVDNEIVNKKYKTVTNDDRIRLYYNLVNCRRALIDNDLVKKASDLSGGFIRNTLRRLSRHRLDKLRQEHGNSNDHSETYKGFSYNFWAFSRYPLAQSILKMKNDADEQFLLHNFQLILNYSGLNQNGDNVKKVENDRIHLIQIILERCYEKDVYINELFLQLIKQTTDHPDPNSRVNLRHWALLSLACSVILPNEKLIQKYLLAHLKRCASDYVSEEGKYARFAEQSFIRTLSSKKRKLPPIKNEIICTINRRPVYVRLYVMDRRYYSVEFFPSQTIREIVEIVKEKVGLHKDANGYNIYEVHGNNEYCLDLNEKLTDIMSKIERDNNNSNNNNSTCNSSRGSSSHSNEMHFFLFKKHLFLDQFLKNDDLVEKELFYHQLLHNLRSDKFPVNEKEATMLVALQAQIEKGDCIENSVNYEELAINCLSERILKMISFDAVIQYHQSLKGMTPNESKNSFLNLIQSWSLYKSTIFDVMQTFTSIWPKFLWLAVDQKGLHLLQKGSRNVLFTYEYRYIISYYPTGNYLMIVTGSSDKGQSKIVLTTQKALQIAQLINDYIYVIKSELMKSSDAIQDCSKLGHNHHLNNFVISRSMHRSNAILHNSVPLVEPQPG